MSMPMTPAEARVNLSAIRENVALLRERSQGAETMAVVKSDGYGHGLAASARASLAGGATRLGAAYIREALALRADGITAPVMAWIIPPGEPLEEAIVQGIDLSAGAVWLVDAIAEAAGRTGRTARVHLKVDTGISRGGASGAEWPTLVERAMKRQVEGTVEVVGLWSHLACADMPGHPSIDIQIDAFDDAVAVAKRAGIGGSHVIRHLANSAAVLTLPRARYDMVRPGLAVFGLSPIPEMGDFGLRPAMTLVARIAMAKRVPAGAGVSYGHTYLTGRETTLGLVPLGYADGIMRNAGNLAEVFAGGRRHRVAGRVCMDQFVIDVGDDPLTEGDEVIVFGDGSLGEPTLQEWADSLGTITHEIVTRIGSRIPRVYH